jgi:hypothetical protein
MPIPAQGISLLSNVIQRVIFFGQKLPEEVMVMVSPEL